MGSIRRDQLPVVVVYTIGAVFLLLLAIQSNNVFGWGALAFFLLLAWWSWPLRTGRHVSHADAQAGAGDDDVIVYWRPG